MENLGVRYKFLTAPDLELADVGVQRVVVKAHAAGNGYTNSENEIKNILL